MSRISDAIENVIQWNLDHAPKTKSRCLEAVRFAVGKEGMTLPFNVRPDNTALGCLHDLKENPQRFGWQPIHREKPTDKLPEDCLVFFDDCGKLKDGRIAGHIALYDRDTNKHYANEHHKMTKWWMDRIAGAFVPISKDKSF